jgi:hypothetical protein
MLRSTAFNIRAHLLQLCDHRPPPRVPPPHIVIAFQNDRMPQRPWVIVDDHADAGDLPMAVSAFALRSRVCWPDRESMWVSGAMVSI